MLTGLAYLVVAVKQLGSGRAPAAGSPQGTAP